MTKDLEFITIYPRINVYRNTFKDVEKFLMTEWTIVNQSCLLYTSPSPRD